MQDDFEAGTRRLGSWIQYSGIISSSLLKVNSWKCPDNRVSFGPGYA